MPAVRADHLRRMSDPGVGRLHLPRVHQGAAQEPQPRHQARPAPVAGRRRRGRGADGRRHSRDDVDLHPHRRAVPRRLGRPGGRAVDQAVPDVRCPGHLSHDSGTRRPGAGDGPVPAMANPHRGAHARRVHASAAEHARAVDDRPPARAASRYGSLRDDISAQHGRRIGRSGSPGDHDARRRRIRGDLRPVRLSAGDRQAPGSQHDGHDRRARHQPRARLHSRG